MAYSAPKMGRERGSRKELRARKTGRGGKRNREEGRRQKTGRREEEGDWTQKEGVLRTLVLGNVYWRRNECWNTV